MATDEKQAARQQIATERWIADVLDGQLSLSENDLFSARRLLADAYKSTHPLPQKVVLKLVVGGDVLLETQSMGFRRRSLK